MQYLIDQIGAVLIAGFIILMITSSNIRMNDFSAEILYSTIIQREVAEVSKIIDFDFDKIGYGIDGDKIKSADSNSILFYTDFITSTYPEGDGTSDALNYSVGTTSEMRNTTNENDMPLYRDTKTASRVLLARVTRFNLSYFDALGNQIPYASLNQSTFREKIRSIKVICNYESADMLDSTYTSIEWEKKFSPKSLNKLN